MLTSLLSPCLTGSPLPYEGLAVPTTSRLQRWVYAVDAAWEVVRMRGTVSREHPGEVSRISTPEETLRTLTREVRPLLERL
ncbi:hypothetical protein CB1_001304001 [Camelus ferus]|nr:hypothetical protein CB1_001304001 [Camelus ferus]